MLLRSVRKVGSFYIAGLELEKSHSRQRPWNPTLAQRTRKDWAPINRLGATNPIRDSLYSP